MARDLATQINRFIASTHPNAPLAGQGEMLVRVGQKYGVDPRVLAIIARKESQFGKTSGRYRNNAWGWGVHLGPDVYTSPTWEAGAEKVARGLAGSLYKGAGKNTLASIIQRYAPPSENDTGTYIRQISDWYRSMGGNPSANVFNPSQWGAAGGTAGATTRAGGRRGGRDPVATQYEESTRMVPGQIDTKRLMMLLRNQRERSLRGIMPADGFMRELGKLTQSAMPRAETVLTARTVGRQAAQTAGRTTQAVKTGVTRLSMGGGPGDHHNRPLGNWQSDDAYDLMGKKNQPIHSAVSGVVTKISGKPNQGGGTTGYGITVKTPQGDLFFKHLATNNVKVGQRITVGDLLGTLDNTVNGGPHLHLGGTNRRQLDALAKAYTTGGGGGRTRQAASVPTGGAPRPGGGWNGSEGPVRDMAKIAAQSGLSITSGKRDRQATASGGVSDHWTGSTSSYALDLGWGGERPTHESDVAASRIVRALGGPRNWGLRGGNFTTTRNGLRWQVIYRSDVGGNHWNHIHVAAKRV